MTGVYLQYISPFMLNSRIKNTILFATAVIIVVVIIPALHGGGVNV